MDKYIRNYLRAVWLPAVALIVSIGLYAAAAHRLGPGGRVAALVLMMACYVWAGWAEFRHMQRMDEMRRRLEMEAMVLAFIAGTGVILALYLAQAARLATVPFAAAPLTLWCCYVLAHLWARLRYRYWSL